MNTTRTRRTHRLLQLLAVLAALLPLTIGAGAGSASTSGAEFTLGTWLLYETLDPQPVCGTVGYPKLSFRRQECGFGRVTISPATAGKVVNVELVDGDGTIVSAQTLTTNAAGTVTFDIIPSTGWDAGPITARATLAAPDTGSGDATFVLNPLEVSANPVKSVYEAGEPITVDGIVAEFDSVACCADQRDPVPASVTATLHTSTGTRIAGPVTATANDDGEYTVSFPGSATAGLSAGAETNYEQGLAVRAEATYDDPTPFVGTDLAPKTSGRWVGTGAGSATVRTPPANLLVENSFVSAVGWVKPGETYPFRVFVKNFTDTARTGATVTIPPVDGTTFTQVSPVPGSGSAAIGGDGSITWTIGSVPAATATGPGLKTLVVEGRADTLNQDTQIVWKNLSSTATLSYAGGPAGIVSTSHGPKVIPPKATFDTARYGDRPFPVVPVDYFDRKHEAAHTGDRLANGASTRRPTTDRRSTSTRRCRTDSSSRTARSPPSASRRPAGTSTGKARSGSRTASSSRRRPHSAPVTARRSDPPPERPSCRSGSRTAGTRCRVTPSTTAATRQAFAGVVPALVGVGPRVGDIDRACGPTAKAVYDAAHIADPEIDYSDYDTDKDGVVDFFMMVFVGTGGNGASQASVPPYDNIWPHSSSLEFTYTDPETGQKGYVSDDQLKDLHGRPLFYTTTARAVMTTSDTGIPVYVRVGPYNVNPEDAIEKASVISHEYGHSLGLPDYYSGAGRETYGTWNLMATDYSQNMDINGRQELGWVIPRVLEPGQTTTITNWADSKTNTHRIDWKKPDGTPYTLSGPNVANGEAYVAKLPAKRVIDPAKIVAGGSPTHVWWSGSGNDFGCAPDKGHNLDVYLPELRDLPAGTQVKATFKSLWDIEWDFDYGFVMISTDGGKTYTSLPSANNYTTPGPVNPNANALPAAVRQRDHGVERLVCGRDAGGRPAAGRAGLSGCGLPRRRVRPQLRGRQGDRAPVQLLERPGPRPAGLVHRRPEDHGRSDCDLRVRLREHRVIRTIRGSSAAAARRTAGRPSGAPMAGGTSMHRPTTRPTTPTTWSCGIARASTSTRMGRPTGPRASRRSPAASRSSTRTRHTVTGTPARPTRPRRRCSTRSRSRATTPRTSTTPPGRRRRATTRSPTRAPAGPTTTSIRAPTTSSGTSAGTASRSRCSRCRATETAHVRRRAT